MQIFLGIIFIILIIFFTLLLHEIIHFLIFKVQKVKILSFGVFIFNIINGKLIISTMGLYSFGGHIMIDTSLINSIDSEKQFLKKIRVNHILTNLINFIVVFLSLFLWLKTRNSLILTISITNLLIVVNSFYSPIGDIRIISSISKNDTKGLLYLNSSAILTYFNNVYLYNKTITHLETIDYSLVDGFDKIYLLNLLNYVIDYHLYHKKDLDNYLSDFIIKNSKIRGVGEYLYFKLILLEIITNKSNFKTILNDENLSYKYQQNIEDLINKYCNEESSTYLDLNIDKRYGVLSNSFEFINFMTIVYDEIMSVLKQQEDVC